MERIAGHYDKIILTLIMCLVILFMATFSPLAESTNAVGVIAGSVIAILIAGLAAVGITFVTTGAYDNLSDYVESLFLDFADSQGKTPEELLKGTQSGTNKLGQLLLNNRFVILIDTFASWLIATLNITNNATVPLVVPGVTLGSIKVWRTPAPIIVWDGIRNTGSLEYIVFDASVGDVYVTWMGQGTLVFFSKTNYTNSNGHIRTTNFRNGNTMNYLPAASAGNWVTSFANYNTGDWYVRGPLSISNVLAPDGSDYYTDDQIGNALHENPEVDVNNTGIYIESGNIILPTDDDNYIDGSGAVIDVGADWGDTYTDVIDDVIPDSFSDSKEGEAEIEYVAEEDIAEEVESTSEITNLPAGTIPFTPMQLPQFHLVDIWHYVAQWIDDTAVAAGTLMAIVVQEPHPMVNLFYATVCLAIIFGLIKGLAK